jgi:hypothetical protein
MFGRRKRDPAHLERWRMWICWPSQQSWPLAVGSGYSGSSAATAAPGRDTHSEKLQLFRRLHSCSGCFRLEPSPGGTRTHWKVPPFHGARPNRTQWGHSAFMFAALMIGHHFSISAFCRWRAPPTLAVRAGNVGAALGIGVSQDILSADLVVQGVEAIAGFCLRFRMQRLLQFLNTIRS